MWEHEAYRLSKGSGNLLCNRLVHRVVFRVDNIRVISQHSNYSLFLFSTFIISVNFALTSNPYNPAPNDFSSRCFQTDFQDIREHPKVLPRTTRSRSGALFITAPYPKRTHTCGSLSAGDAGSRVILTGWLLPERKGKSMSFFHLKDTYGMTQLIANHNDDSSSWSELSQIPVESVILIEGVVLLRPQNARIPGNTGAIDVQVDKVTLLNPAVDLPFLPSDPHNLPNEALRARYRYLDLRRTALSDNIKKRSRVAHIVRSVLDDQGFTEVETPVLLRSSPEGAREFLVPTRSTAAASENSQSSRQPLFYALQQSPQQPKQLLICSGGVDKYFQIAKCFRDEDGRKDRQPEFTQIDLEMAFVSWGNADSSMSADSTNIWRIGGSEVRDTIEALIRRLWKDVEGVELPETLNVMTYHEAMTRFGSDKPDARFGLEIINLSDLLAVNHPIDSSPCDEILECIIVPKSRDPGFVKASRASEPDSSAERITLSDATLRTWLLESKIASRIHPTLGQNEQLTVNRTFKLKAGDDVWLASRSRKPKGGSTALGRARIRIFDLAQARGEYVVTKDPHFLWITEFPLFTKDDADKDFMAHGRWSSSHHPFTAPMWQDIDAMYRGDIETVRGQHYDLVLNGVEIGGGSVRIHDAAMQEFIFANVLQLNDKEKAPFNQLLNALQCGAPPHGGIALGFDRLMAMLCKTQSIRDVIAFPKTGLGTDLLFKSPAAVSDNVLSQYGIKSQTSTNSDG
ncbi:tRNA synthetases class II-domain-containing protein [Crassisporium funariophilum]|nr:tRNA synthetases class II-domain-containing protein [Crassisporium funariophilum]